MKKLSIIVIAIIMLLIIAVFYGVELKTAEFGVSFTVPLTTTGKNWDPSRDPNDRVMSPNDPNPHPSNSNWPSGLWGQELISTTNPSVVITAWNPNNEGATSEMIACQGITVWPFCSPFLGDPDNSPSRYYYKVYIRETGTSSWIPIVDRSANNEVITVNADYVYVSPNSPYHPPYSNFPLHANSNYRLQDFFYYLNEQGNIYTPPSSQKYYYNLHNVQKCGYYYALNAPMFTFSIKGHHIGALRVEYWEQFRDWCFPLGCAGTDCVVRPIKFQQDYIYLASGVGSLDVENIQGVAQSTFEEGDTVVFSCDVDYSGQTMGTGQGWKVRLFNLNTGNEYFGTCIDGNGKTTAFPVSVPDAKRDWKIRWIVPNGVFDPNKDNQWKVELWNDLFNQHEEYLFTIDESDKAPPAPYNIIINPTNPQAGDTVTATIKSYANLNGSGYIAKFFVFAYQDNYPPYLFNPQYITAYSEGGNSYVGTCSFTVPIGNKIPRIRAWSNDGQGRQSITYFEKSFYVKEPDNPYYTITVIVKDSETLLPIIGATVTLNGGLPRETDSMGKTFFGGCSNGNYIIQASKSGYTNTEKLVSVQGSDVSVIIYLSSGGIWSYIIPIIMFILFLIGAVIVKPLPIRIILLVFGIAISIITYMIMSGII